MARQIDVLTSIRGLAAWWVVFYHSRSALNPYLDEPARRFIAHGDLAVDMFFVLSGFVIYLNYADRMAPSLAAVSDFMLRRIARIYPLHLVMLLAFAAYVAALIVSGAEAANDYSAAYFVQSLFLVQNWGFTSELSWNVPAWSISTELFAYLTFPVIALLIDWRRIPTAVLAALVVGLSLGLHLYFRLLGYTYTGDIAQTGLVRCIVQFAIGAMVCAIYLRLGKVSRRVPATLLVTAALLVTCRVLYREAPVIPLIWVTVILGFALWRGWNPLNTRPLVWLGDISYATYLCHYLAFIVFKYVFVEEGAATPLGTVLGFYVAVLVASHLLYRHVEKPGQRWVLSRRRRAVGTTT